MTDASVPVGDRNEPPAVRPGPSMARAALARTQPVESFLDQVVGLARREEWAVLVAGRQSDAGYPTLVLVRHGRMVAAWIASAPIGFKGDRWRARLGRMVTTETAVWSPRDGMGPVEQVLGGGFDRCGRPSTDGSGA